MADDVLTTVMVTNPATMVQEVQMENQLGADLSEGGKSKKGKDTPGLESLQQAIRGLSLGAGGLDLSRSESGQRPEPGVGEPIQKPNRFE